MTWEIEIEAESPRHAAVQALEIQRDPVSIATIFEVKDNFTGEISIIDAEQEQD